MCYINSVINPILYAFLNKKYRSEFVKLFSNVRCLRCLRKSKNKIKKQQNTSTILKASVKSHHQPSSKVNYEQYNQNFDTPKSHENYKRIISKPNEFVLHYPLIKKDDLKLNGLDDSIHSNDKTFAKNSTMNRSQSEYELYLKNRKKNSKRSSFSGSLS